MSEDQKKIMIWNRAEQKLEAENVFGDAWLRWAYASRLGSVLRNVIAASPWFSRAFGAWQSTHLSAKRIPGFIRQFSIRTEDFEPGPYQTFNDFFVRRLRSGARTFVSVPDEMPAFAEGRYLAFDTVDDNVRYPVKGKFLTPGALLADPAIASQFQDGPLLIARLCPVDYHRFHFPDDGKILSRHAVRGRYDSVNPVALFAKGDIFMHNERVVSILETTNFGKLAYVEVGALCVGRIVQTHSGTSFCRGAEKGYFLFGGSTVVVLGQQGAWSPARDLLERTQQGVETLVRLGEQVATRL